jgi:hypothetical protein
MITTHYRHAKTDDVEDVDHYFFFSHAETGNFALDKWGRTTGNAATVAHRSKKQQSGKDSVIKGQPLLLFM